MSSKTRILVLKKKEILYTVVFLLLAVLLIVLLYFMFFQPEPAASGNESAETAAGYTPGVYTTSITLGSQSLDVEVTVDADHINSVRLVDLTEAATTMYPLVEPAIDNLALQIVQTQSVDSVTYSEDTRYTSSLLLGAIQTALDKAKAD